jgi:uncharacterized protein (TIGR03435 family)
MHRFLALFILFACLAAGQSFEVASVRQAKGTEARVGYFISGTTGAKLTVFNLDLLSLIERAYNMREYQITGPESIKGAKFEIKAKLPSGTPRDDMPAAVQALLRERFKMVAHKDTKELPYYELTVAKDGPKLKAAAGRGTTTRIRGLYSARNESMAQLSDVLSRALDRAVVDSTGLTGRYDFVLDYTPDDPRYSDMSGAKSVFTALQQQLGLKLESRKGPTPVLVVESIQKTPTAN